MLCEQLPDHYCTMFSLILLYSGFAPNWGKYYSLDASLSGDIIMELLAEF
ncbi:MAG: hypothetical protein RXR17_06780 [Sulfolobaceae archaeon]